MGDIDGAFARLGLAPLAPGRLALRNLLGIDRALIARWTPTMAQLMPHGGPRILRRVADALLAAGLEEDRADDPLALYPEAATLIEARMLEALARAASPPAIDLLLAQPSRWARPEAASDPSLDRLLNRLIDPPLVAAIGGANIGKSTLVNALAGRAVAIVADEPGTTRDHVGVLLDLAGLVVRYIDTPGLRNSPDPVEREALRAALLAAAHADLILHCGDQGSPPPPLPPELVDIPRLTIAMRVDLGAPSFEHDAAAGALHTPGGSAALAPLVAMIRERLVPAAAIAAESPWKFWQDAR